MPNSALLVVPPLREMLHPLPNSHTTPTSYESYLILTILSLLLEMVVKVMFSVASVLIDFSKMVVLFHPVVMLDDLAIYIPHLKLNSITQEVAILVSLLYL